MPTHIAIEALIVLAGLIIICLAYALASWEQWDEYRRLERQAHLNLTRGQR